MDYGKRWIIVDVDYIGHGGSFTTKVSDSKQLRTPKVELGLFPYVY